MNPKLPFPNALQSLPGREVKGLCEALFVETEPHPETRPVMEIALDLQGIPGTRHYGFTRKAGPREPWYKRGMEMRSGRQITVVSQEELSAIAAAMQIDTVAPEWIGANIVTSGIPHLTLLPPGTRIVFAEATIVVEAANAPCRIAGKAIARHLTPDAPPGGLDLAFPAKAGGLRGVVASVERAGTIRAGEPITVKVPPQTLWQAE
ncbi:MOSC domain-containing protein [Pseudorhodoplanes sp.]|uniref:MOSC domain-containing protein n=1 Tax=Pseudorhodoplanes sp. TaxID=1934341 RepID=UPI002BC8D650|nr:MOSC domain-containing protein [Pseudorhodoplanes sp.]HWV52457.1 MOSC domain-containing protein [Pseudorhodoplanes sp.]